MSEEELRAEYRRLLDQSEPRDRAGCPAPEMIRALVDREGTEAERMATLDHVMSCGACQRDFEMFRAPRAAAATLERRALPTWLAAAAVLVLTIGATWLWRAKNAPAGSEATRGGASSVELVGPMTTAPGSTPSFVWRSVQTAQRYQLELDTEAGDPIYETTTSDTTAALPASIHLTPGTSYRWWVRATLTSGAVIRSSALRLVLQRP